MRLWIFHIKEVIRDIARGESSVDMVILFAIVFLLFALVVAPILDILI
jgi:hypothetical protein